MENFLIFRLYGPLAAWGEIAVDKFRRSSSYPSRSAILGLISAALGIPRGETRKLSEIFTGYDVAIKVLSVGTSFTDFHTVTIPAGNIPKYVATRKDEVTLFNEQAKSESKTSRPNPALSYRSYICDSLSIVALRSRSAAPYTLEEIQFKLINPEFVLYLGRKSCPLSAPLKPQIVKANGFRGALDNATFPPLITAYSGEDMTERFIPISAARYYWENEAGDMEPQQTFERYDEPLNKSRWQFAPRKEHLFVEGSK